MKLLAGSKSLQNLNLLNMDWVDLPYISNDEVLGGLFLKPSDHDPGEDRKTVLPIYRNSRLRELLPGVDVQRRYEVDEYFIQSIPLAPSP